MQGLKVFLISGSDIYLLLGFKNSDLFLFFQYADVCIKRYFFILFLDKNTMAFTMLIY